jgi:hypothetical protein
MQDAGPRQLTAHQSNPANAEIQINVIDKPGAGGANHHYEIVLPNGDVTVIKFQNGPIAEAGVNGVTQEALLAIVADRLESFQAGPFKCPQNTTALQYVMRAMFWLHDRTKRRQARGVEGTSVA